MVSEYTLGLVARFNGDLKAAIDHAETLRAQAANIAHNTRHQPTTNAACDVIGRTTESLVDLRDMLAKEETAAAIMSGEALLMAAPAETIGDRLFDAVCAVGTAAGCFVAAGLMLATAAFAILPTVTRAETMPAKTGVVLMAIDLNGEGWIAGKGDTCEAAMLNAVYPADMVDLKCLPATSPFNHE